MKSVLCFGDSNTYGLNPKDKSRFSYETRWTGILDKKLRSVGYRVIEEGLCGRTTIFPDTLRQSRRGVDVMPFLLESHSPVDYVIIMLGTNDCKSSFNSSEALIAEGIRRLIRQVHNAGCKKILLVSPIYLADGVGDNGFDKEFNQQSVEISKKLKYAYSAVAQQEGCIFLAASDYALPSAYDREHLDERGHSALAAAIYNAISVDILTNT